MSKIKFQWVKPFIGLLFSLILLLFLALIEYDEFVKHPEDSALPTGSGRLFNLLFHLIDRGIGKVGVFVFLGLIALFFLYKLIQSLQKK